MSYSYDPNWTSGEVVRHASRWWNFIAGAFMAAVFIVLCAWIAVGNLSDPPIRGSVAHLQMYHIGDFGYGKPTYGTPWSDVGLCPGEVIYYPQTDVWRCE